jgi:hypothetical protein
MHHEQQTLKCYGADGSGKSAHNFQIWNGTCGCRKGEYDGAPGEFDGFAMGAGLCLPCPAHSTTDENDPTPARISSCKCEAGFVGNIQSPGDNCSVDPCLSHP